MKFVINDTTSGKAYTKEVELGKLKTLLGKKVREEFDGGIIDLPGYKLKITGGSDKNGFPMRYGVHGSIRKNILISGGIGFNPKIDGQRRRKSICGEVIGDDIAQINCSIQKSGKQKIEEIFGSKKEDASEDKKD